MLSKTLQVAPYGLSFINVLTSLHFQFASLPSTNADVKNIQLDNFQAIASYTPIGSTNSSHWFKKTCLANKNSGKAAILFQGDPTTWVGSKKFMKCPDLFHHTKIERPELAGTIGEAWYHDGFIFFQWRSLPDGNINDMNDDLVGGFNQPVLEKYAQVKLHHLPMGWK